MTYRLQRQGIIDLTSTFIYKTFQKYLGILTEEVSDRVVINVLNGVQDEMSKGSPVVDRVIKDVILPRQDIIAAWTAHKIGAVTLQTFEKNEEVIRSIINESLEESIKNNPEIGRLKYVPGVGKIILDIVNSYVSDITYNTIRSAVVAFSDDKNNREIVKDAGNILLESLIDEEDGQETMDEFVTAIAVEVIEVVKSEVAVQQWKIKEEQRKAERLKQS